MGIVDRQDIGRDFWHSKQRERKSRIVNVDGHQVLRENMYDINSVRTSLTSAYFEHSTPLCVASCSVHIVVLDRIHVSNWLADSDGPHISM